MPRCVLSGRRIAWLAVLPLVCLLASTIPVAAQGSGGVILGTVKDAQGGVLPGASLTIRNVETGVSRNIVSEGDGTYRFAGLPPGRYELTAELSGFANADLKDLTLTIGLELRRDLVLPLQGLQESLTVTGQAPVVETTKTDVASVVTQEQIDSLPVANRQPISLALLLPGTSMDNTTVRRSQANIGAGGGGNTMNAYILDGGMNWSNNSGQQHLEVPQSAIREFKVNISQATAEYGGNVAGVVVTVTKSGTNRFSGEALEYFRDKSLNAMNKFEQAAFDTGKPKPAYRRNMYGIAVGGPIIKDRLHFFVSVEPQKEDKQALVNTGQPQFYSAVEGAFPANYERRMVMVRGDLQMTPQQNLFIRYAYDKELIHCETCGGTNAAFSGSDVNSPRDSNLVGHTWVLGTRALNEVRLQIPPSHLFHRQGPPGAPLWDQQGQFPPERFTGYTYIYTFPSLLWGSNTWSFQKTQRTEIRDDFTLNFGTRHALKIGGAFLNLYSPEEQQTNLGTWTFGSDQFFDGTAASIANLKNPSQFTASFPPMMRYMENHWIQGYVQDQWHALPNLTVDLGIRYDNQYHSFNNNLDLGPVPKLAQLVNPTARGDNNNFGVRAGFAWDVNGDGRTVVRSGYGRYYQYVMQGTLRTELSTLKQTSIIIRNPSYPDPYGGKDPATFASTAPPNVDIVSDSLKMPAADALTVGFSRELRANLAVHVDGIFTRMVDLPYTANINTPVAGVRPRPDWGRISQLQSRGKHDYNALMLRLEKRYSDRYQFLLSYTLSKQDDDGSGSPGVVSDFYNPSIDWGPGNADRRHMFVGSGSIMLPLDINFGAVFSTRSTMPFSATAGADLNNDGNAANDLVPGTTRNVFNRGNNTALLAIVNAYRATTGRAPIPESQIDANPVKSVDLRASKQFLAGGNRKIEVIAQLFNVFGWDNLLGIQQSWTTNALSASFGRILSAQPRQVGELGVRFIW